MSCGTCGIQASDTMQGDTGVPAGAPTTEQARCPHCKAFVAPEGTACTNPRCPSTGEPLPTTTHSPRAPVATTAAPASGLIDSATLLQIIATDTLVDEEGEALGGMGDACLLTYRRSGIQVVRKSMWAEGTELEGRQDGNSEVAAYRLAHLLGEDIIPPTVFEPDKRGTQQLYLPSARAAQRLPPLPGKGRGTPDQHTLLHAQPCRVAAMLALDFIIGNHDRNEGNYLFDENDNLWGCDHGQSAWLNGSTFHWPMQHNYLLMRWLGIPAKKPYKHPAMLHGQYQMPPELVARWRGITKAQFDAALEGIAQEGNVQKAQAWANLQYLLDNDGLIVW